MIKSIIPYAYIYLRPSGPISKLFMDKWVKELRKIEAESKELVRINPVMKMNEPWA